MTITSIYGSGCHVGSRKLLESDNRRRLVTAATLGGQHGLWPSCLPIGCQRHLLWPTRAAQIFLRLPCLHSRAVGSGAGGPMAARPQASHQPHPGGLPPYYRNTTHHTYSSIYLQCPLLIKHHDMRGIPSYYTLKHTLVALAMP